MNTLFNVYANIRTPQTTETTTIQNWFNLIKKSEYSNVIESARPFGKGHSVYESNKAAIPAITYNFTFKGYKNDDSIDTSTGLLYIDVDSPEFDINNIETNKIFSYYKSFGGKSYAILVQVSGLTKDNYDNTYIFVCKDLGIASIYDKNAQKKTQFNVLSYDPNIYINFNSFMYSATVDIDTSPPSIVRKEKKKTYTTERGEYVNDNSTMLIFDNLGKIKNNVPVGQECVSNWDGWEEIKCWLPFQKVKAGSRNPTLLSYCNNLIWLNPWLSVTDVENILKRINMKRCEEPVPDMQIKRIVSSVFKYKAAGTLQPHVSPKKRKIVFANHSTLTRDQKLEVCREETVKFKTAESTKKLYTIIEGWDFEKYGKIGQAVIYKNFKISKKTVEKYWPEFKQYVKDMNDDYKGYLKTTQKKEIVTDVPHSNVDERHNLTPITIGNKLRYDRATQLVPTMERWNMEAKLTTLFYTGYQGKKTLVADDTGFDFNVNTEGVDFIGFAA